MIRRLMEAGQEFGVCAYGSEALGIMRIEKGHISGPELNGTTTPRDLGLGGMVSTKKDFIGRVLGTRPGLSTPIDHRLPAFALSIDRNVSDQALISSRATSK